MPGQRITIWQVEAQINFDANNEAVSAELALPNDQRFELVEEFTASPAYGCLLYTSDAADE